MNYRTRLKQLLVASFVVWLVTSGVIGFFTYAVWPLWLWVSVLIGLLLTGALALMTVNVSQQEVAIANKNHSRTKRQVQEHQLKIDRFEYDAKKSSEIRRIVLNSTQEKDHSLRNMAQALDHVMDEIIGLTDSADDETLALIGVRAHGMKRYAADLQSLARLELKSELPNQQEMDFLSELKTLMDGWAALGKMHKIKVKLDNPEEQMLFYSDINWIENLLSRVVQTLIRMNENTTLNIHIIGYLDADLGDALRIIFSINGRQLTEQQLKHVLTEYVSIIENGQEIGPGLAFVVARRMAQMLNGSIDITNTGKGVEVLIVLPRNAVVKEGLDDPTFS